MDYEDQRSVLLTTHELTARHVGPSRGKQRFEVDRADRGNVQRNRFKPKPKAPRLPREPGFNHEQMLQSYKGSMVILTFAGGEGTAVDVRLIDADRYTLMVESQYGRELVFKSSLASIVVQPASETNA